MTTDALKIVHIISSLKRGGRERQLANIYKYSEKPKYQIKIIIFNDSTYNYIEEYNIQSDIVKIHSINFFCRLFELYRIIKTYSPDVIWAWGNMEAVYALLISTLTRITFINGAIRHGIRLNKPSHNFRMLVLHLCKHIVANSYAGLHANKLKRGYVLYNGIDDKFINKKNSSLKKKKLKETAEYPLNVPILVSVANLVPYKDYYTVLSALKKIKDNSINFFYFILGDGPLKKETEDTITKYGLRNDVKLIGNVQNVDQYLRISDLFIHSSKGEGCSNAVLEAMAAGLPIIASNTGGTSEILSKKNGFLFKYKDDEELFRLIKDSLLNINSLKQMGHSSIQMVEEKFTINCMMTKYYRIIEKITQVL